MNSRKIKQDRVTTEKAMARMKQSKPSKRVASKTAPKRATRQGVITADQHATQIAKAIEEATHALDKPESKPSKATRKTTPPKRERKPAVVKTNSVKTKEVKPTQVKPQTETTPVTVSVTALVSTGEPQFTIAPDVFRATLQSVERAISKRSTMPVLNTFHIQADAETQRLKVTATNLDLALWRYASAQVSASAALCFPTILTPLVGNVYDEGDVTIALNPKLDTARVQAGALAVTLKCLSAEDFPSVTPPDILTKVATLEFTRDDLKEIAARILPFASTNEARPVLTGIHVVADANEQDSATVRFTSADGFRLAELTQHVIAQFTGDPLPSNWEHALDVIVPARVFTEAAKLAPESEDQTIGIAFYVHIPKEKGKPAPTDGSGIAYVDTPQGGTMAPLIAGTYPNVSKIIELPAETKTIPLATLPTLWALAGARLFADSLNAVKLTYTEQRLIVKSSSSENGDYTRIVHLPLEGVDLTTLPANGFTMSFNVKYLGELIRAVAFNQTETSVQMQVSTPSAPMFMGAGNYQTVLMPMNIATESTNVRMQPVSTATPPEPGEIDNEQDVATVYDAALESALASDPDPAHLQDIAAEQVVEETDAPVEPRIFTVICPCQTQLEIVEGSEDAYACPNCERILDDKGNVITEPITA